MICIAEHWKQQKDGTWKVTIEGNGTDVLEVRTEKDPNIPGWDGLGFGLKIGYIPESDYRHKLDVYNRRKSIRLVVDNEKKSRGLR